MNAKTPSHIEVKFLSFLQRADISALSKVILSIAMMEGDNWDCSIDTIVFLCKEGRDAVRSALLELEAKGFLSRTIRRERGRYCGYVYTFFPTPGVYADREDATRNHQSVKAEPKHSQIKSAAPKTTNPMSDMPKMIVPPSEHSNNYISINNINNTNLLKDRLIDSKNTKNSIYPNQSINRNTEDVVKMVHKQINADALKQSFDPRKVDDIVALITDVYMAKNDTISAGKNTTYSTQYVQGCFQKLSYFHIEQFLMILENIKPKIINPRGYVLTALINVTQTMDLSYAHGDWL